MVDDKLLAFANSCQGRACTTERRDYGWVFNFGNGNISVETPWRLVRNGRIAYGSDDDRQQFGLSAPIDGEAVANSLINGLRIDSIEFDHITADVHVHFEGGVRLDIFNRSMGYEGWHARFDADAVSIVGRGGGGIVIV